MAQITNDNPTTTLDPTFDRTLDPTLGRTLEGKELDDFVGRYLEMWNEADAARRRATVEALWRPDAANYTATIEAVGHDEIFARVTRSYDAFVGAGTHRFRLHQPALAHHGAVRVWWEMVTLADGEIAAIGEEFLVLDENGRIRSDHQFPVAR